MPLESTNASETLNLVIGETTVKPLTLICEDANYVAVAVNKVP